MDFRVARPKLLFKSRHQSLVVTSLHASIGCTWSLLMSRPPSLVVTSAQVFYSFQMVVPDVAKSVSCRDINVMNCIHQLISYDVVTSISCRDIIPLVPEQSIAAYTMIPIVTCIKFPSIFLTSRLQNWTAQTQNCINESASCFHSCSAIRLHFYSTYCYIFLLSSILPANNKLVSLFIFLQSNSPFLYEKQAEKWTKNR